MRLEEVTQNLPNMSLDDLHALNKAVINELRDKMSLRNATVAKTFSIGDTVSWHNKNSGNTLQGKIVRCNQKSATVMVGTNQRWSVPWSLLTKMSS